MANQAVLAQAIHTLDARLKKIEAEHRQLLAQLPAAADKLLILDLFEEGGSYRVRFRRRPATRERIECRSQTIAIWYNLTLPRQYMRKIGASVGGTVNSHTKSVVLDNVKTAEEAESAFNTINVILGSFNNGGGCQYFQSMDAYIANVVLPFDNTFDLKKAPVKRRRLEDIVPLMCESDDDDDDGEEQRPTEEEDSEEQQQTTEEETQ